MALAHEFVARGVETIITARGSEGAASVVLGRSAAR